MPLSEREQRILEEIERNLSEEDPRFARATRRTSPRFGRSSRGRLGAALFLLGLAMLIAFFATQQLVVGVVAFGAMVAGIVLLLGASVPRGPRGEGGRDAPSRLKATLKNFEQRIRNRYKRI